MRKEEAEREREREARENGLPGERRERRGAGPRRRPVSLMGVQLLDGPHLNRVWEATWEYCQNDLLQ